MVSLILWHYRVTKDSAYLRQNYPKIKALLEAYRREYEKDGLLRELNKWCVVEWPANFRHGYDVDIREGQVCEQAHISINAYYIYAVQVANEIATLLGEQPYRDMTPLTEAFVRTFYDAKAHLFRDGERTAHVSLVGNAFVYGFGLYPDAECRDRILSLLDEHGIASLSFFCAFPILMGLVRDEDEVRLGEALRHPSAWLRMLKEDATTTFEGWGKDTKWNTSLFHLTMSYAAVFLADTDLRMLFA
jgi:glycogen debranching enzyme